MGALDKSGRTQVLPTMVFGPNAPADPLLDGIRQLVHDEYEVFGEIGRSPEGEVVYLAGERKSNVEGSTRRGKREFRRFLDISLGSLAELGYVLRLCRELGMLDDIRYADLTELHTAASKVTWGLYSRMATP